MHPIGVFFLMILALLVVPPTLWCAFIARRALWIARRQTGPTAVALYIITMTYCEPLISVAFIVFQAFSVRSIDTATLLDTIRITGSMALVLLPIAGVFFRDEMYRRPLLQLLGLGVVRWLVVLAALNPPNAGFVLMLTVFGTILLYVTAGWGGHTVGGTFAIIRLSRGND